MKIKLTPLNIVSALSMMMVVGLIINKTWFLSPANQQFKATFMALGLMVFFVSFICDQIFRRFVPTLARLWMIELTVIVIAIVFVLVLKTSVFG